MSKKGVFKLLVSIAILAICVFLIFQNWVSVRDQEIRESIIEGYSSGKSTVESFLENYFGVDISSQVREIEQSKEAKAGIEEADHALAMAKDRLSFSPQEIAGLVKQVSDIFENMEGTFENIPLIGSKVTSMIEKTRSFALILKIWFFAMLGSSFLALIGIFADRSLLILPYPMVICGYIYYFQQHFFKGLDSFPGVGKLFGFTPVPFLCAALSIVLLLISIFVRDSKRLAARREARKIRRRGF
jgi:hypothetical protein